MHRWRVTAHYHGIWMHQWSTNGTERSTKKEFHGLCPLKHILCCLIPSNCIKQDHKTWHCIQERILIAIQAWIFIHLMYYFDSTSLSEHLKPRENSYYGFHNTLWSNERCTTLMQSRQRLYYILTAQSTIQRTVPAHVMVPEHPSTTAGLRNPPTRCVAATARPSSVRCDNKSYMRSKCKLPSSPL